MVKDEHKIDLNIPAAVASGYTMAFKGLGEQAIGDNEVSGDLLFEVQVQQHPVFKRQHNNLVMTYTLSFLESVVGKEIRVPHFGGEFTVNTADTFGIIQPDKPYTLRGKGMTSGSDMIMMFHVSYPAKKLSAPERNSLRTALNDAGVN
jgi:DnaJ-class molecular chaperone